MRRVLFLFTLALVVAVPGSQRADACGDKFLQVGRGILQRFYVPNSSASILVFAPPRSGTSLIKEQKFQAALQLAGHKSVTVVRDEAGVSKALSERQYDLALVGQDDLAAFGLAADVTQPAAPTVLPVMNKKPTKSEMETCKRQYDCELKTTDRLDNFLKVMDDAMKARKKAKR